MTKKVTFNPRVQVFTIPNVQESKKNYIYDNSLISYNTIKFKKSQQMHTHRKGVRKRGGNNEKNNFFKIFVIILVIIILLLFISKSSESNDVIKKEKIKNKKYLKKK